MERRHTGREEKLGSHQGSRHTEQHQAGNARPVPKAEKRSPRDCQQPGGSQSSARNRWQDTPEHAQGHKSSSSGATNQPGALRGQEGTFPGGKGYLLAGPGLWQKGLAGLPQDTGAEQPSRPAPGSEFLRFRWAGREVNEADFPERGHGSLPAGGPQPAAAGPGGPRRLFVLRTKPSEQRQRAARSAQRRRQRGWRWGPRGEPRERSDPGMKPGGGSGVGPGSLCTPRPKHTEPPRC